MPATSSATRKRAKSKVKANIFTQLMFRHWTHYSNGKRSHLFIQSRRKAASPRDLTPGDHDVPPFCLGGQDQYAFSPDGKEVAYASNLDEVRGHQHQQRCFHRVRVTGGDAEEDHDQSRQRWHADVFARRQIHRVSLAASRRIRERPLPPDALRARHRQDHRPDARTSIAGSIPWRGRPIRRSIYFTAENEGENPIYALNVGQPNPWPQELVDGYNDSPTPTPDGKTLVFDQMSIAAPNEIYTAPLTFPQCRMAVPPGMRTTFPTACSPRREPLTTLNDAVLSQVAHAADGVVLVQRRSQRKSAGLHHPAAELRRQQEVSAEVPHSRRPARARGATTGRIAGTPNCSPPTATSS